MPNCLGLFHKFGKWKKTDERSFKKSKKVFGGDWVECGTVLMITQRRVCSTCDYEEVDIQKKEFEI